MCLSVCVSMIYSQYHYYLIFILVILFFRWEIYRETNSLFIPCITENHATDLEVKTLPRVCANLWSTQHSNNISFDENSMNFKSSLYKSFIAISNSHRQPYSIFTNPFGEDFLLYFHFIRIGERLNINLFQKNFVPGHM